MKIHMQTLVLMVASALAAMTVLGSQQEASAIIIVDGKEFRELTKQFEKDVLKAAIGDPDLIPRLIDQYCNDVRALDFSTR